MLTTPRGYDEIPKLTEEAIHAIIVSLTTCLVWFLTYESTSRDDGERTLCT